MEADVTPMFPRARDPHVFPASVSQYSVIIPKDVDPALGAAGLFLPAALEGAVPKRKIQFLAGRYCAREAIEWLRPLSSASPLQRDADGCPIWPQGLVGSISHTDAFATAAVAPAGVACALGVDVEPTLSREAADDVARLVAAEEETRRVAEAAGVNRLESLTVIFSAKESLFKALYPLTRRHFDYLDFAVVRLDSQKRRFAIRLTAPFAAAFGAAEFVGRYELTGGVVGAGMLVSESAPG
jgi:enterobactin synthetase component D